MESKRKDIYEVYCDCGWYVGSSQDPDVTNCPECNLPIKYRRINR